MMVLYNMQAPPESGTAQQLLYGRSLKDSDEKKFSQYTELEQWTWISILPGK